MKLKGYIYQYTFPDGKVYIGQTRRPLPIRHRQHLNPSSGKYNPGFWGAYQSVGEPSLSVLEIVESEDLTELVDNLNRLETAYIFEKRATDPHFGYNRMASGTVSSPDRTILKKEYFRLCNQAALEKQPFFDAIFDKVFSGNGTFSEDEILFIKESLFENNLFSDALLEEMDINDYSLKEDSTGVIFEDAMEFAIMMYQDETNSIIRKYIEENGEMIIRNNKKGKIIQQLDKEGNVLREFWSNTQIREAFGVLRTDNIDNVLKGRQKTAYGYYWRYKEE